ncbi:hypothetical protein [Modestobacter sp. NPDC049651]|uniref:hypothetical protein n=1 Tax=unclassified Modestobacter TaxID=2643866 RepID=UPI0033EA2E2E
MTSTPQVEEITPELLAREFSIVTAVTRLDFLSRRDNVAMELPAPATDDDDDDWKRIKNVDTSLDADEALELLALGEVVARKAHDSRQLGIRAALRGGAGWERIGTALGVGPRAAWEQHTAWLDAQAAARRGGDLEALDEAAVATARELAGPRPA